MDVRVISFFLLTFASILFELLAPALTILYIAIVRAIIKRTACYDGKPIAKKLPPGDKPISV
jgi:predicted membrane protein